MINLRQIKQGERRISAGSEDSKVEGRTLGCIFTQTRVAVLVNMRGIRNITHCEREKLIQLKSTDTIFWRVNLSSRVYTGKSVEHVPAHKSQLEGHSCTHLTPQCIYIWIDNDVMNHEGWKSLTTIWLEHYKGAHFYTSATRSPSDCRWG